MWRACARPRRPSLVSVTPRAQRCHVGPTASRLWLLPPLAPPPPATADDDGVNAAGNGGGGGNGWCTLLPRTARTIARDDDVRDSEGGGDAPLGAANSDDDDDDDDDGDARAARGALAASSAWPLMKASATSESETGAHNVISESTATCAGAARRWEIGVVGSRVRGRLMAKGRLRDRVPARAHRGDGGAWGGEGGGEGAPVRRTATDACDVALVPLPPWRAVATP